MSVPSSASAEQGWLALDKRVVVLSAITMAGAAAGAGIPTSIGIASNNTWSLALAWVIPLAVLLIVAGATAGRLWWSACRYRVTPERLERRFDLIVHTRRSLARERIRTVDVTANPLHRLLGLAALSIGTGQHDSKGGSRVKLEPLARPDAERLRVELLSHAADTAAEPTTTHAPIAALDWRWLRYAPVSFVAPLLGAAAFGIVLRVSEWFGAQQGVIAWVIDVLSGLPLVLAILVVALAALVVGVIASLVLWVEMWWHYRLEREQGGMLRVRRGLLTTRSISFEENRLRGIDVVEPLGNRPFGAARVDVIATGMRAKQEQQHSDNKTLLPAAPRAQAHRVGAAVLREEVVPTESVRLIGHPRAARARRLRWALGSVLLLVAILVVLGVVLTGVLLYVALVGAVIGIPVAIWLAFDAYRNLGHGITGEYLVTRSGAMRRSTAAIQRQGVIGWRAKQSIFQRRAGLITVTATTAAGGGAYSARDVAEGEGLAFAEEAVGDLFGPFLQRV